MGINIQCDPFHPFGLNIIVKWNNNSDSSGPTEWDIPIFFFFAAPSLFPQSVYI